MEPVYNDFKYQLLISKKYKYVYCLISKNGCSSILTSILINDYHKKVDPNIQIWKQHIYDEFYYKNITEILWNDNTPFNRDNYKDYKKFIVLRNPRDRFISYINHTYKEPIYDSIFDKTLAQEDYVNLVLSAYPFYQAVDRHAVPQRNYYEKYLDLFGKDVDIVMIEDLPEYYKKLTGQQFIKNNVTDNKEKICTWNTLTENQKNKIEEYIQKYEFTTPDTYSGYWNA